MPESKTNEWGADPKKYKELCKPFEDEVHARAATNAFLSDVRLLREKHRIPELVVHFHVYLAPAAGEEGRMILRGGAGWGDQRKQAQIAKELFDREFESLCGMVYHLAGRMPNVRTALLTDPTGEIPKEDK